MNGRLHIAFLDSWTTDPARGSGSAVAIAGLGDALRRLGHAVTVVAPRAGRPGRAATRLLYNLRLPQRVSPERYDLVVGFDLDGCFLPRWGGPGHPRGENARSRPGSDARRISDPPRISSLKGVMADEARFEAGLTRLRLRAFARLEGRAARRADRVVVTSRYSLETASRAYRVPRRRFVVVPEGVDLAAWERARRARGARRPASVITILSVARQYPRKNTVTLLRALREMLDRRADVRLRIVGGGPELPGLRREARRLDLADRLSFLGDVGDPAAVRCEYLDADLFCLPSQQEGFGIVFLEAMAAGLPVVAGRAAAVPEVVADGVTGRLVDPSDKEALARALLELVDDAATREQMGRAARRRVRRYDWSVVGRRFLSAVLPHGSTARPAP